MATRSNRELIFERITDDLTRLSVINLNFYESFEDRLLLKQIFSLLFHEGDILFFSFRREEDLTDNRDLLQLREKLPREFISQGKYVFIRKIDSRRFDSLGYIRYTNETPAFLLDVWRYFYAFDVFIPNEKITWDDYVTYVKENGLDDVDGKRLLKSGMSDFILIKGLGGDYLNISYLNNIVLPDVASLLI